MNVMKMSRAIAILFALCISSTVYAQNSINLNFTSEDPMKESTTDQFTIELTLGGAGSLARLQVFFNDDSANTAKLGEDFVLTNVQVTSSLVNSSWKDHDKAWGTSADNYVYIEELNFSLDKKARMIFTVVNDDFAEGSLEKVRAGFKTCDEGTPAEVALVSCSTLNNNNTATDDYTLTPQDGFTTGNLIVDPEDVAGFMFSKTTVQTFEGGASDQFTIALTSQPYPPGTGVKIPLSVIKANVNSDDFTGSISPNTEITLGITPNEDWNHPETVTVSSGNGTLFDPNETFTIVTGNPVSEAPAYKNFLGSNIDDVSGSDVNNDVLGDIRFVLNDVTRDLIARQQPYELTVQRSNCSTNCATDLVKIEWRTEADTATLDEFDPDPDPPNPNGELTWVNGDNSNRPISITIQEGAPAHPSHQFFVKLSKVGNDPLPNTSSTYGDLVSTAPTSTITIPDTTSEANPGYITVADMSVEESNTTFDLTLVRNVGKDGAIDLTVSAVDGMCPDGSPPGDATADSGDYSLVTTAVHWDDQDPSSKPVTVQLIDDGGTPEADQYFCVKFALVSPENLVFDDHAEVRILANDTTGSRGQVEISDAEIMEGNLPGETWVELAVNRTVASDGDLTVNWHTETNTATSPADYTSASGSVSWADSEQGAPTGGNPGDRIRVQITNNLDKEDTKDFKVVLEVVPIGDEPACQADTPPDWCNINENPPDDPDNPGVPVPVVYDDAKGYAKVTIIDDDNPGSIVLVNAEPIMVGEKAGVVKVVLNREDGTTGKIVVNFTGVDGGGGLNTTDANDPADYHVTPGTLTWDNVGGTREISIPIVDDGLAEGPEYFHVDFTLDAVASDVTPTSVVDSALVQIDDQVQQSTVNTPATQSITESLGMIHITVSRVGTEEAASIHYETKPGTALPGTQYVSAVDTIVMSPGQAFATIDIQILKDANYSSEQFTVEYSKTDVNNNYELPNTVTVVTILDPQPEAKPGQIVITKRDAKEGSLVGNESDAEVTFSRIGGTDGKIVLNWNTADLSAKSEDAPSMLPNACDPDNTNDYKPNSGTLIWEDGIDTNLVQTVSIATIDDLCVESGEQFEVEFSLVTGDNGSTVTSDEIKLPSSPIAVGIQDNDGGGTFKIDDVTLFEYDTYVSTVEVTISREDGSRGFVYLQYKSEDGTAVAPADYASINSDAFWANGDTTTRKIQLHVVPDQLEEGDEYFTISMFGAESEFPVDISDIGTVTIKDPIPIPTLSEWAMALMVLLLMGMGVYALTLRRRVTANRK